MQGILVIQTLKFDTSESRTEPHLTIYNEPTRGIGGIPCELVLITTLANSLIAFTAVQIISITFI